MAKNKKSDKETAGVKNTKKVSSSKSSRKNTTSTSNKKSSSKTTTNKSISNSAKKKTSSNRKPKSVKKEVSQTLNNEILSNDTIINQNASINDSSDLIDNVNKEEVDISSIVEASSESIEESPSIEGKVDISTNNSSDVLKDGTKNNKHPILIALLVLIAIVVLLFGFLFVSANNIDEIKDNFDDIDLLKASIIDPTAADNTKDETISSIIGNVVKNMDIDFSTGLVTLNASKSVIYTIADLDTINNAVSNYGVKVDKFGFSLDPENSVVDAYASAKKWFITAGIHAQLAYEFTENEIILTIKDVEIGNLPKFLYKSFIPVNKEIGRFDISKVNIGDDIQIKVFSPNKIKEIGYDNNNVSVKYNVNDVIDDVMNDVMTPNEKGETKLDAFLTSILEMLGLDKLGLENFDLDDLKGLIDLFIN